MKKIIVRDKTKSYEENQLIKDEEMQEQIIRSEENIKKGRIKGLKY